MRKRTKLPALALGLALLLAGCGGTTADSPSTAAEPEPARSAAESAPAAQPDSPTESESAPAEASAFALSSPAIVDGVLAEAYGKRGQQVEGGVPTLSPPMVFEGAPEGTVSYALVMRDPDSVPVVGYVCDHWLIANIMEAELEEGASQAAMLLSSQERTQGENCFGTTGYGGPAPPDAPHTYVFTAYALDDTLELAPGYGLDELEEAMGPHILASATLEASYSN